MSKFQNSLAIITGGASGIGLATVELFISHGAKILVIDSNKEIPKIILQTNNHYLCLDVAEEDSWIEVVSYLKNNHLNPNILVNNAGISGSCIGIQNPIEMSLQTWETIHKINATSVFLGCKYISPLLKNKLVLSSIINVASRSGLVGVPSLSAYASSKASIINYTKSLALFFAEHNYPIKCNYVAPAAIFTNLWSDIIITSEDLNKVSKGVPLGRMGTAQEVADAILYFASPDSGFTTGTGLIIDGGILAGAASSPIVKKQ